MTIEDLFTTYWSQVTLILIAIGYFIKRRFDNSSKKIEINHSLFQQNKLKTLTDFFANYVRAETMWNQIAIWEILERKVNAKEIDNMIFPILNDLKRTLFELKIYFKKEEPQAFRRISECNLFNKQKNQ